MKNGIFDCKNGLIKKVSWTENSSENSSKDTHVETDKNFYKKLLIMLIIIVWDCVNLIKLRLFLHVIIK